FVRGRAAARRTGQRSAWPGHRRIPCDPWRELAPWRSHRVAARLPRLRQGRARRRGVSHREIRAVSKLSIPILLTTLLLAGSALAQDPPPAGGAQDAAPAQPSKETPATAPAPKTPAETKAPPEAKADSKGKGDDRFKPTEEISEDLSVSFP